MRILSKKRRRSKSRSRAGAAAVEFAIIVPVFFLFILAAFEFGRLNILRHTADNAAYEAARHAMVPGATSAEAIAKANSILNIVGTQNATITINPSTLGPDVNEITVTVEIPMNQNGLIAPHFSANKTIRVQSRLRTERSQD